MTEPAAPPPFPGRTVRAGAEGEHVRAVQARLRDLGCGDLAGTGSYGPRTAAAVKLFQTRFPDAAGNALVVDGEVGPVTWAALFGAAPAPSPGMSLLVAAALRIAGSQVGTREKPPGSNRGPMVDAYLHAAGLDAALASYAWCQAFVYWCYKRAAEELGVRNPTPRTASVVRHWQLAGRAACARRVTAAAAAEEPSLVRPGQLFLLEFGRGLGHIGFVEQVLPSGYLQTVEGNSNDGGSREGTGVFRLRRRKVPAVTLGFVDYGAC